MWLKAPVDRIEPTLDAAKPLADVLEAAFSVGHPSFQLVAIQLLRCLASARL
jgi:hypothetical protein